MTDTRTTTARIIDGIAHATHGFVRLLRAILVLATLLTLPITIVYVIVHFIVKYW